MLAIMSNLPSVNQTSWGHGHSHLSNLSLSDIGSFDEEKLDEILPPGYMVNTYTFLGDSHTVEVQLQSDSDIRCHSNHDQPLTEVSRSELSQEATPQHETTGTGRDVTENQIHLSQYLTHDPFDNVNGAKHFSQHELSAVTTRMSSSPDDDEMTDLMGRNNAHHESLSYLKRDDSPHPPLSTLEFMGPGSDALFDTDTMSTSHSVGSSIATDAKKIISDESLIACSNSTADGRWTREEHEAFLHGLQVYGREWKRVAQNIPTRTSSQIRSHAQKYFAKMAREEHHRHSMSSSSALVQGDALASGSTPLHTQPHSPLTPSAQALLERILVDPEAVQREVEDRLSRLRTRYRELQITMEHRQGNGHMSHGIGHPFGAVRKESDSQDSSSDVSSPNTMDMDKNYVRNNNAIELIPDSHPESIGDASEGSSLDLLQSFRLENPSIFHHHLQNTTAIIRRKRVLPIMDTPSSLSSGASRGNNSHFGERQLLGHFNHASRSPAASVMDGRAFGNEELIALEVLGGDLRRNSSVENLNTLELTSHGMEIVTSADDNNDDGREPQDRISPTKRSRNNGKDSKKDH